MLAPEVDIAIFMFFSYVILSLSTFTPSRFFCELGEKTIMLIAQKHSGTHSLRSGFAHLSRRTPKRVDESIRYMCPTVWSGAHHSSAAFRAGHLHTGFTCHMPDLMAALGTHAGTLRSGCFRTALPTATTLASTSTALTSTATTTHFNHLHSIKLLFLEFFQPGLHFLQAVFQTLDSGLQP